MKTVIVPTKKRIYFDSRGITRCKSLEVIITSCKRLLHTNPVRQNWYKKNSLTAHSQDLTNIKSISCYFRA